MHTTEGTGCTFMHNGDFSGDVIVCQGDALSEGKEYVKVSVPFKDIKTLVAAYVRGCLIADLEEVDDDNLLLRKHGRSMFEEE